jgi:glutamyl-tRNA reductase
MDAVVRPARGRRRTALLVAGHPATAPAGLATLGDALADALPPGWSAMAVMRTGPLSMAEAVRAVAASGADELVVVPLHPQYVPGVTGAILQDLYAALRRDALHLGVTVRTAWHDDAGYVHALARDLADRAIADSLDPATAHLRFECVRPAAGDERESGPYRRQLCRTAELVVGRVGWAADRWLLTDADAATRADEPDGARRVLVCRLPFPPDVLLGPDARRERFVEALRSIVLNGPLPAAGPAAPLLSAGPRAVSGSEEPMRFLMVGASLGNGMGPGRGPAMRYSDPRAFAQVKRSRGALRAALDHVREHAPLAEAFVWNTCQRIELYGWLPLDADRDRAALVASLRQALFGSEPHGLEVNVLDDRDARHHLLRTACGLNSGLPGDRDVAAQLQTAGRIAQCTKTGGARTAALVDAAVGLARDVHARTAWGRFSTGYCAAALTRVCEVDGIRFDRFRHVVIGGSTTSRSILTTLSEEHGVPHRQMTLVYRDHHGQLRQLRAALGSGRKLRVHDYGEDAVLRAIADADFVFFGIDQAQPVLHAARIRAARDVAARRLTLVDFNEFGSIAAPEALPPVTLWTARELDEAVAAHAAVTLTRSGFTQALAEAEAWILGQLPAGASEQAADPSGSHHLSP